MKHVYTPACRATIIFDDLHEFVDKCPLPGVLWDAFAAQQDWVNTCEVLEFRILEPISRDPGAMPTVMCVGGDLVKRSPARTAFWSWKQQIWQNGRDSRILPLDTAPVRPHK